MDVSAGEAIFRTRFFSGVGGGLSVLPFPLLTTPFSLDSLFSQELNESHVVLESEPLPRQFPFEDGRSRELWSLRELCSLLMSSFVISRRPRTMVLCVNVTSVNVA